MASEACLEHSTKPILAILYIKRNPQWRLDSSGLEL
jgi:hypothetical protein